MSFRTAARDIAHPFLYPFVKKARIHTIVAPVLNDASADIGDKAFQNLWYAVNSRWACRENAGFALRGMGTAISAKPARLQRAYIEKAFEWLCTEDPDYTSAAQRFFRTIDSALTPAQKDELEKRAERLCVRAQALIGPAQTPIPTP